ncbi:MAG TPA: 4-(cytidine 5'-diphospho)-2-C-methyl-D-erythritol kinase [Sphingomonadaceae bacterium]|nr:4-(cytidine 5'-diphospho)-2-C-methyl-D-erythritol kinase [Sphingomonadaceae bacterium]
MNPGAADSEIAYAKINLALHVRRRRADGYHDLETLFAFAQAGDRLEAAPAGTLSLTIDGPFGRALTADEDNLVLRAAHRLRETCGIRAGAALRLDKRLPVAAGIGGGSADAAAALRLLARLWGVEAADPRLAAIAASLGADVPACLVSRTMRGEGVGERLAPVAGDELSGLPLLLVNPGEPLGTAAVFAGWDGIDRGPLPDGDPLAAARAGRNDLEPAALGCVPAIGAVLEMLAAAPGVLLARMSGSGATCFALFADAAARDAAAAHVRPGWWSLATGLR